MVKNNILFSDFFILILFGIGFLCLISAKLPSWNEINMMSFVILMILYIPIARFEKMSINNKVYHYLVVILHFIYPTIIGLLLVKSYLVAIGGTLNLVGFILWKYDSFGNLMEFLLFKGKTKKYP